MRIDIALEPEWNASQLAELGALAEQNGILGKREYRRYEKLGFGTPSGKVELKSSIFEKLGAAPLPEYKEPVWSPVSDPEMAEEYPLILITGSRFMPMYHSEQRQIKKAREKYPDPLVTIHPETAAKYNLEAGDWAVISTPLGKVRQRVKISDIVRQDMCDMQHGWWFPELDPKLPILFGVFESNANILCPDDPESWPRRS